MSGYTEKMGNKLNELLERTYDAEKGFKNAAENVKNPSLKNYFNRKAQERYDFGHKLKTEIRSFGQDVEKGGSLAGTAHRAWMDLKSYFSSDNEEAILEEAIRGEKAAVKEYDDVLEDDTLPYSTKSLLIEQKNEIEKGLASIKRMEDIR
ncbi:ferritin-like domain-containing protein [Abyssalbus ytuae]|uniref:PA2169 family four-helix-bundle protein n=1 Tax=Abyssalbus ytuae TaxID=2926907 RepID=A0A9E6ZM36_9FLAO|nr:PA2169 family four-helix-bundle protein [Abyssalbus ytuae]UOB16725.1 PA2169 family four-helix-bundle protein [Abyssalbus ytuae]